MKSLTDEVLKIAVTLMVAAILIKWAIRLLLPVLPVVVAIAAACVVVRWLWRRNQGW